MYIILELQSKCYKYTFNFILQRIVTLIIWSHCNSVLL